MAKIPTRKDSGPAKENMTESTIDSIESKGLPSITVGSPPMANAKISEIAVNITKAIPIPTDHLPKRVFGIKSIFINFNLLKFVETRF